jgi:hypothetical protein
VEAAKGFQSIVIFFRMTVSTNQTTPAKMVWHCELLNVSASWMPLEMFLHTENSCGVFHRCEVLYVAARNLPR